LYHQNDNYHHDNDHHDNGGLWKTTETATTNLAIANRSCVSMAHTVTTVHFQGVGEILTWQQAPGTLVVATAARSINGSGRGNNFSQGTVFHGEVVHR